MKLSDLIRQRVSIGKFVDDHISTDLIISLLDDAVYAPNHKMREPWRFIIVEGDGKDLLVNRYLHELSDDQQNEVKPSLLKIFSAPLVLAVVMPTLKDIRDELEDLQANAAMIQNFLLLCTEQKLSTFWKTPLFIESDRFKDVLGLENHEIIVGLIMVGYPNQIPVPKKRKSARDKTTIYK